LRNIFVRIKARSGQAENRHHDYRRGLFLELLKDSFGIGTDEIDVEKYLRIDMRRKGWIDALFRDLVFEFKRNLTIERDDGLRELDDYLRLFTASSRSDPGGNGKQVASKSR
jgi:hypothetical protein